MHKTKSGFTIVELLVVIVIIAILAAITIVAFNGIQERARKTSQQAMLTQTERSIMRLAAENGGDVGLVSGALVGYQDGFGTSELSKPFVSAQNITLYGVFDATSTNAYNSPVMLSPDGGADPDIVSRFKLQASAGGLPNMGFRIDTGSQPNVTQYQAGVRSSTLTRSVGWLQISNTTAWSFGYNQANPFGNNTLTTHTGFNFSSLSVNNYTSTGMIGVAGLAFNTAHDQSTRLQVMKWLAQKYNVPISL